MRNLTAFLIVLIAALATGCGGSGSGSGGAAVAGPAVAMGTMTKGSVIVNDIHFLADAAATITVDDNPGPESELRSGMSVKVKGVVNDDGVNGRFEKVEAEPEVRGVIEVKGAVNDFQVNGQVVIVNDDAIFEDRIAGVFSPITFANLALADFVEVHGIRDDLGRIRAARIERRDDRSSVLDEIKGTISTVPTATTFQISSAGLGTVTVNLDATTSILPAGAALNLGDPVEVHGNFSAGVITATRIDREDLEDNGFEPGNGVKIHVEGHVSGFTGTPGVFQVAGRTVRTTSATVFMRGNAIDLDNGVRVEAEGHVVSGELLAVKIKFKRPVVRLMGTVTAHSANTITMFGKTVSIDTLVTRLNNVSLAAIVDGTDRLEIRGCVDSTGAITAFRVDPAGGGNDFIQGPVSAKDEAAKTLVLMSGNNAINANLSGVLEANFRDAANATIGSAAFFAAVIPTASGVPGTVVKAKGTFSGNTITATEVEIEN